MKRLIFRTFNLGLLTALLVLVLIEVYAQDGGNQPNIIFIICDQMRGDAFGAYGNNEVNTPNLDRLANEGVMMTNAFVNNPVCLPSRISMFSGKYPTQTGIYCNKSKGPRLQFEGSLPWHLRKAGYAVGYVGKNHAFTNDELEEFDVVHERGREKSRAYSPFVPPNWHSDIFWPEEDCNPIKNTNDAIEFIEQYHEQKPFFLTVSYFDPHPPYMAPARVTSKYCADDIVLPPYVDPQALGKRIASQQIALQYDKQTEYDLKETMRYYYASIEWGVDEQVGKILKALKDRGIGENTIIILTSDHGDFMGEFNMVRKGIFLYDALLHVPMIWFGPSYFAKGLRVDNLTQNVDILPTLLEIANVDIPNGLDGHSVVPLLKGNEKAVSKYVFAAAGYSELPENYWESPEPYYDPNSSVPFHTRVENLTWQDEQKTAMVRSEDWKLIVSETDGPELYFMDGQHTELENLFGAPKYEDIFQELKSEILKHCDFNFVWE